MKKLLSILALATLTTATVTAAEVKTWTIDRSHSWVGFTVRHMMVSNVRGEFGAFEGSLTANGDDPTTAQLSVTIDATTIDTREPKRDEHLRSADFFDTASHAKITFTSKRVERAGAGLKVTGDLTMRGVTKEVVLDVTELTPAVQDPWGGTRVGAHATTKVNRKEFGLAWSKALETGGLVVADEVNVILDVELVHRPAAAK